jgi:Sec-independent protein secretion pathway component TatC
MFVPPALCAVLAWIVDNVPMSFASQQGYGMVFGLPLVMASLASIPVALVLSAIHRREWPLPLLAALTVGLLAMLVTETPDRVNSRALAYGLIVLAAQALWFFWRRRRTAEGAAAVWPAVLSIR